VLCINLLLLFSYLLLVSNDHVLESTSNDVTSNDTNLCIQYLTNSSNPAKTFIYIFIDSPWA